MYTFVYTIDIDNQNTIQMAVATKKLVDEETLRWKVNTPQLLKEILGNNGMAILFQPINIYKDLLEELAERASELNDPKLNAIMCRMALYEVSDPYSKDYDAELTNKTIELGYKK